MANKIATFAVACAIAALCLTSPAFAQAVAIDGDTFRHGATTYRIQGLDTPETFHSRCKAEKNLGHLAKVRLQALLRHPLVEIHAGDVKDKYGRTLASVVIGGENINDNLIEDGLAVAYHCPKNRCPRRINWCLK